MKARMTLAALLAVLMLSSATVMQAFPKLPAGRMSPDKMEGWCGENGGVYLPPTRITSTYGCILPDGSIILCGGTHPGCDIAPANERGRHSERGQIDLLVLLERAVLDKVDHLEGLVSTVLTNQSDVAEDVNGLQLACSTPDLVPLSVGRQALSRCDGESRLHVTVHNQGGAAASASQLQVFFRINGVRNAVGVGAPAPALSAFSGTDLTVDIPPGCFDIDAVCTFNILVDGDSQVREGVETNNTAAGECYRIIQ